MAFFGPVLSRREESRRHGPSHQKSKATQENSRVFHGIEWKGDLDFGVSARVNGHWCRSVTAIFVCMAGQWLDQFRLYACDEVSRWK